MYSLYTGVYLSFQGDVIQDYEELSITMIREGVNEALLCLTDFPFGTRNNNNNISEIGTWYFPNNKVVNERTNNTGIFISRGDGVVRLHRKNNVTMPTGQYRCEIPDASNLEQILYINLTLPDPTQPPSPPTSTPTSTPASITSSDRVLITVSAPASIATSIASSTTASAPVTDQASTPQTSTVAVAVVGALVSALLLIASVVILAIVITKRYFYAHYITGKHTPFDTTSI